ncbi:MAG: hypothetical protein FWC39_07415 [Bacteroidetes bacterium]|nr:hypothetical protein [Bacteroidota bacterium]
MKSLKNIAIAIAIFLAGATVFTSCGKENFSPEDQNQPVSNYAENTGVTPEVETQKSEKTDVTPNVIMEGVDETNIEIYERMMAKKERYPHKMTWTNDSVYAWKGGVFRNGKGCAAFAFILSDAAFGNLPAQKHTDFNKLKVGDVLCIDDAAHTVMVIGIGEKNITLAEGNVLLNGDKSDNTTPYIYWGRKMSIEDAKNAMTFILTRYASNELTS